MIKIKKIAKVVIMGLTFCLFASLLIYLTCIVIGLTLDVVEKF